MAVSRPIVYGTPAANTGRADYWYGDVSHEFPATRPSAPRETQAAPPRPAPAPARPAPAPPAPSQAPSYRPLPWTPPTTDLDIINEIADCLNKPPTTIDQNYILRSMHIAEYLKVPASIETSAQLASNASDLQRLSQVSRTNVPFVPGGSPLKPPQVAGGSVWRAIESVVIKNQVGPTVNPTLSVSQPVVWVANEAGRALANQSVANVLALIKRVEDFSAKAAASGFIPPDNPFTVIATLNAARGGSFSKLVLADQVASDLLYNIKVLIDLVDAENQGGIDLSRGTVNQAQLSHVRLSFDGFGGSGNPGADILRFLPSADDIKRKTEQDALSVLDFTKRVPYVMFTMEYRPVHDSPPVGTLVAWKKIADASGYVLKRRNVFSQTEYQFTVDNSTLSQLSRVLRDYVKIYATTFFNRIDENSVMVFLDATPVADEFFIYTVQAYQVRSEQKAATFSLTSTPVSLTPVAKSSIDQIIQALDPSFSGTGVETISPWPAFSQFLYGNSNYDWILAAVNTRASIDRGDTRPDTRSYSYLNAHSKFLLAQADAGKLVKPADINDVVNRVSDSIQKFGVQQTVQNLFDETGISYYYEGRDARDDTHFDRAGTETVQTSNLFAVVGAAIDPDTAIMNIATLANNMAQLLNQNLLGTSTSAQSGAPPATDTKPQEISVPVPGRASSDQSVGQLQSVSKLDIRDPFADLTTFDGISKMMRAIRIISDFGPNRAQPSQAPAPGPPVPVAPPPGSQRPPIAAPIQPTPIIKPSVIFFAGSPGLITQQR